MKKTIGIVLVIVLFAVVWFVVMQNPSDNDGKVTTDDTEHAENNDTEADDSTSDDEENVDKSDENVDGADTGLNDATETDEQEAPIEKTLDDMTLDEKIGQMLFAGVTGTEMTAEMGDLIENTHVGGVIFYGENVVDANQFVSLVNAVKEENKENVLPLFLGADQEGGRVSRMPEGVLDIPAARVIGDSGDVEYAKEIGGLLGQEMNTFGLNWDFAPVLDVNSNPDNPVIGDRSYGVEPGIVSDMGLSVMKGIQSEGVIPVVKHFPGHGDTGVDSHLELPKVDKSLDELQELELIPFKKAVKEGADVVLTAHILLPQIDDVPASLSRNVITRLLRSRLGYNGLVITDDMTMGAIVENYGLGQAAVMAVQAGSDMVLVGHEKENVETVFNHLKSAVQNDKLSEDRIDESLRRIINLKEKYDLNRAPVNDADVDGLDEEIQSVIR